MRINLPTDAIEICIWFHRFAHDTDQTFNKATAQLATLVADNARLEAKSKKFGDLALELAISADAYQVEASRNGGWLAVDELHVVLLKAIKAFDDYTNE